MPGKRWSQQETEWLIEAWQTLPIEEISTFLERSVYSLKQKVRSLNISKHHRRVFNGQLRICSKCKEPRFRNQFYSGTNKDGLSSWCKFCIIKLNTEKSIEYAKTDIRVQNRHKRYNYEQKLKVLNAYGGTFCRCCGEDLFDVLTVDHINGDGAAERRKTGIGGGTQLYRWLIKNNFPGGYQILCYNCNIAKHRRGICPHQINLASLVK